MKAVRSLHYVPGNKPEWLVNAPYDYDADGFVFDLEDSVPLDEKDSARETVFEAFETFEDVDPVLAVRVNSPKTDLFHDDLKAIVHEELDAVRLPMVSSPGEIRRTEAILRYLENTRDIDDPIEIMAAIETAQGTRDTFDICKSSERVALVGTGTGPMGDLAGEMGYEWTPEGLERLHLTSKLILDATAANMTEIHTGVWMQVDDIDGLEREAEFMHQLGMTGQPVIHPSHIEPVNEIYKPDEDDVDYARRLIETLEEADGTSAVRFEGQMIDTAHANSARRLLQRAEELGMID